MGFVSKTAETCDVSAADSLTTSDLTNASMLTLTSLTQMKFPGLAKEGSRCPKQAPACPSALRRCRGRRQIQQGPTTSPLRQQHLQSPQVVSAQERVHHAHLPAAPTPTQCASASPNSSPAMRSPSCPEALSDHQHRTQRFAMPGDNSQAPVLEEEQVHGERVCCDLR